MLVDVSGFTALSEALSKEHGQDHGAELLNLYINAYMRKLIEYIEKAGGGTSLCDVKLPSSVRRRAAERPAFESRASTN